MNLVFGKVTHSRTAPSSHSFVYPVFYFWGHRNRVNFGPFWFWSHRRKNILEFRDSDYLSSSEVRSRIQNKLGRSGGEIWVLSHLRTWGYLFNPVSFYVSLVDGKPDAVVAEITNTPWKQKHSYVVDLRAEFPKTFHVSPFMGMDQRYEWTFRFDGQDIGILMKSFEEGRCLFTANLYAQVEAMSFWNRLRALWGFPMQTLWVAVRIHWQAIRLLLKGVPFYPHPDPRFRMSFWQFLISKGKGA